MTLFGESGLTLFQRDSLEGPFLPWLFSPIGAAFIQSLSFWPIPALLGLWGLSRMDSDLVEQIRLEGGSALQLTGFFVRILLQPLGLSAILVGVLSFDDVGTPEMLQVQSFPVVLYTELNLSRNVGALLPASVPAIVISIAIAAIWFRIRYRSKVEWSSGPSSQFRDRRIHPLASWTPVLFLLILGPVVSLSSEFLSAFRDFETIHWPLLSECIGATVWTGAGACILVGSFLFVTGALKPNKAIWIGAETFFFLLFAAPSPLLALIFVGLFAKAGDTLNWLLNSFIVLSLACAIRFLWPAWIAFKIGEEQLDPRMAEQAALEGAGRWRVWLQIRFPLLLPYFFAALLLVWVLTLGEVALCRILQPPGVQTLAARTVNFMHWGHDGMVASGLILLGILEIAPFAIWIFAARVGAGLKPAPTPSTSVSRSSSGGSGLALLLLLGLLCGCNLSSNEGSWGEKGTWRGALFHPRAVEALPDGNWVVLDRTDRVQIFSATGEFIRLWRTPETGRGNPRGLDVDRRGNILVADTHYGRVLRYSPQGELLQTLGEPGSEEGKFGLVTDIVEDASGFLTTIEYGDKVRVQRFDAEGRFIATWGEMGEEPGQLRRAQGLCLSLDGKVIVADSVNHRIQIFDREGNLLQIIGEFGREPGQMAYPYDVATDPEGRIYVIEFGNYRLQVFGPEGESLLILGGPGRELGQFDEPWGVTVLPSGEVLIADTRNHRIQNLGRLF
jgi:ABC-type Fe3+ transport system permease subunit